MELEEILSDVADDLIEWPSSPPMPGHLRRHQCINIPRFADVRSA